MTNAHWIDLWVNKVFYVFTDFNIDAPPSLKPNKKYSDISGLPVRNYFAVILIVQSTDTHKTFESYMKYILNTLSTGKLHRPSDKAALHFLGGVLLHPASPH